MGKRHVWVLHGCLPRVRGTIRRERDVPGIVAPGSHVTMNRDGIDVCNGVGGRTYPLSGGTSAAHSSCAIAGWFWTTKEVAGRCIGLTARSRAWAARPEPIATVTAAVTRSGASDGRTDTYFPDARSCSCCL